jgi:hypothetical protein
MNNEIENKTHHQDTVEQNQNAAAPAAPSDLITGSELITDNCALTTAEVPVPTTNPTTDSGHLTTAEPGFINPPLDPGIVPNRRRGPVPKIAQLPPDMRAFINERLLLGTSYTHICELLEEKGYPGFNHANICRWTQGGFKTWAFVQADQLIQKTRRETCLKEAVERGHRLDEAALNMALTEVCDVVADLDVRKIQAQLSNQTGQFVALFNGLSRLVTRNNALERIKNSPGNASKSVTIRSEPKGGLTEADRDRVAARLGI